MENQDDRSVAESELLKEARTKGLGHRLRLYARLAGPGWLQSALMLGGGTLAGSLYLGVLSGFSALWLQPLAMLLTVVMMSAIAYMVMASRKPPFQAINEHLNPVFGWGWALASLASCMVWAMPQYSLAAGVLQQNLLPGALGPESALGDGGGKLLICAAILTLLTAITWNYGGGGRGVRLFELIVKVMVAVIVVCFVGVVVRLGLSPQGLDWAGIWRGYIPDPGLFFRPAEGFVPLLEAVSGDARSYWQELIVVKQRDVMVAVTAAAAGVNATFLFAYSILRRGWGREFHGLSVFDLSTGMLIPFAIATSCVVIAAASQFHTQPYPDIAIAEHHSDRTAGVPAGHLREYEELLRGRVLHELGPGPHNAPDEEISRRVQELSAADRRLASTLLTRDAFDLARSLQPLTGDFFARIVFGIGVLGMTLSSITLHMLISGMVLCEILRLPHRGWPLRLGSLAAATGVLGPFLWDRAAFWLAIPTSVFAFLLLPLAYLTFFFMMNHAGVLGRDMPVGWRRVAWNGATGAVVVVFSAGSAFMIWDKGGTWGMAAAGLFLLAAAAGQVLKRK